MRDNQNEPNAVMTEINNAVHSVLNSQRWQDKNNARVRLHLKLLVLNYVIQRLPEFNSAEEISLSACKRCEELLAGELWDTSAIQELSNLPVAYSEIRRLAAIRDRETEQRILETLRAIANREEVAINEILKRSLPMNLVAPVSKAFERFISQPLTDQSTANLSNTIDGNDSEPL